MQINKNFEINGLIEFVPKTFKDDRGAFIETFNSEALESIGFDFKFKQDNQSISSKGVFRGIHLQVGDSVQGKLVRVANGSVIDYAIDLRPDSPTFGKWESILLSAELGNQFWVPPGFGHAFLSLEDDTIFCYKCTETYNKDAEVSIKYNDPSINLTLEIEPLVSDKDIQGISLQDFKNLHM